MGHVKTKKTKKRRNKNPCDPLSLERVLSHTQAARKSAPLFLNSMFNLTEISASTLGTMVMVTFQTLDI